MYMCIYMHVCARMCMHACMRVYMCVYTYAYIYTRMPYDLQKMDKKLGIDVKNGQSHRKEIEIKSGMKINFFLCCSL